MKPHNRWSKDEEAYLLSMIKTYRNIADLPLVTISQKLERTTDSIRRKAIRLKEMSAFLYEWDKEESKEAFLLYLEELSLAEILKRLHEQGSAASLKNLEEELKRLKEAWSEHIRKYAEERQLPTAKHFKPDTLKFYIENRTTDSDFIRKALHKRIKNG